MKEDCKEFYSYYDSYSISRKYLKCTYDIENIDTYKIEMLCENQQSIDYCLSLVNNDNYNYLYDTKHKCFELYSKVNTKGTEHFDRK